MKRYLLPIDFSAQSNQALSYMIERIRRSKGQVELLLLHTYLIPSGSDQSKIIEINDKIKNDAKADLELIKLDLLNKSLPNLVDVKTHVVFGRLKNVIARLTSEYKIDTIVMAKDAGNKILDISKDLEEGRLNCSFLMVN